MPTYEQCVATLDDLIRKELLYEMGFLRRVPGAILKDHPDLVIRALVHGDSLYSVPESAQTDDIVATAIAGDGLRSNFPYVYPRFQTYEMCLAAVRSDRELMVHVAPRFHTPELLRATFGSGFPYMNLYKGPQPEDLCVDAVRDHIENIDYIKVHTWPVRKAAYETWGERARERLQPVLRVRDGLVWKCNEVTGDIYEDECVGALL